MSTVVRAKSALSTDYVSGAASPISDTVTEDSDYDLKSSGGGADGEKVARKFTATATDNIESIAEILGKTGSPAGTITASIFSDNGGLPLTQVGGDSVAVSCSALSAGAGGASQTFTWTAEKPELTASSVYWIVLSTSGYTYANGVTEVRWRTDANGGTNECAKFDSPVWTLIGAAVGAAFTVTYADNTITTDGAEAMSLYVDFTLGSSSGMKLRVEFTDDRTTWYQETEEIPRRYASADTELYKTDGYSGSDADVADTEVFGSDIDLTENDEAVIDIKYDGSGNTDDLLLALYRRRDRSWDGDETAVYTDTITSDGTEDIYSLVIDTADETYGKAHFRISLTSEGASDTFEIDAEMRYVVYQGTGIVEVRTIEHEFTTTGTYKVFIRDICADLARTSVKALTTATGAQVGIKADTR